MDIWGCLPGAEGVSVSLSEANGNLSRIKGRKNNHGHGRWGPKGRRTQKSITQGGGGAGGRSRVERAGSSSNLRCKS